jgi:hypothetical protein
LVVVIVSSISLCALAGKHALGAKVFLLKSGGGSVAELHVFGSATVTVEGVNPSGHTDYNISSGVTHARGGAILRVGAGTNSISVRAEEIESVPDPK